MDQSVTTYLYSLNHKLQDTPIIHNHKSKTKHLLRFQIVTFVILMATINYGRACMFYMLDKGGPFAMMWGQVAANLGVTLGAVLSFVLVSVNLFQADVPSMSWHVTVTSQNV